MNTSRYPKNCYLMLKRQDEFGRVHWVTTVKNVLYRYGFGYVWVNQEIGNVDMFTNMFKQRIKYCMYQNWAANVNESSRCDTCRQFKSHLNPERYLSLDMPFLHRRS